MEVCGQLASSSGRLNAAERTSSNRKKGGPHSRSGRFGDEKNLSPLDAVEPLIVKPLGQIYVWFEFL
jgi:hypothetical protein